VSSCCSRALAALALAACTLGARAQDSVPAAPAKPTPLFTSDSVFALTIAADIKKYMGTRDSTAPWMPGRLVTGADTIAIGLKPRGHFRRKSSTCGFPPVSVKFDKKGVKGTVFAKQEKLKLVTTCWPGRADYEAYIPREYLLYKVYNLITNFSFLARYVRVTYADTAHADRAPITTNAFFVEDQGDMAARNAGVRIPAKGATRDDFDQETLADLSLFEFMIGNTDLSFAGEHNVRFVRTAQFGIVFPVPYDFDWSGVVDTRYAKPDPSLPIHSVRDRLWMSFCFTPEQLAPAIARFNAQRDAITAIYANTTLLEKKDADAALAYFADFYTIINDPKQLTKAIQRHCAG